MSSFAELASFTSSALGSEAIRSMALELMIFCATIVVAIVVKVTSLRSSCSSTSSFPFFWLQRSPPHLSKEKIVEFDSDDGQFGKVEPPSSSQVANTGGNKKVSSSIFDVIADRASVKNGNAEEALSLYAELRSSGQYLQIKDLARQSKRHSALDFYAALLQSAVRASKPQQVQGLLDDMKEANIERPLAFYESAMKVLSSKKFYKEALLIYDTLTADGLKPSPVTLSCLINFTAEIGDYDRAIGFFEQLASTSTPSIRAYMTALRVHSKRQDWNRSLQILRSMQARKVQIDTLILNTILSTGVAAGKTEPAEALLHEMAKANPRIPDVISYNTVLKGYAHQKTADKALTILNSMLERGVKPNGITFNTVMDAAVRCAQVEDAWKVLDQMRKAGIQPDKYTCTILMKGLHEESTPKQLSNVLEMLQLALPQCDTALRSSLFRGIIQVAARLNNTSLLMQAFRQMRDQRVLPTSNDFQIVIYSLAQQGNITECATVWQYVRNQNDASVVAIFTAVMEDFSKKEKVEGMICAFQSLRDAVADASSDGQKDPEGKESHALLQQCRAALMQAASRKQHSSPAFRRLLELAPEHGLSPETLMIA